MIIGVNERSGAGEPLARELGIRWTFRAARVVISRFVFRQPQCGRGLTHDPAIQVVLTRRNVGLRLTVF